MDVFDLREGLIDTYRDYATSFMRIRDDRIRTCVEEALDSGRLWPHPRVGLNPAFEEGGTIEDLVEEGLLHPGAPSIFRLQKSPTDAVGRPLSLYRHQTEAIRVAANDRNYVLTTGTGSGKSLAYIIPIADHVLRTGSGTGVKAVVVYPMNALANSQIEELSKFLDYGPWVDSPVTFERYTGQDDHETRDRIQHQPPDILLTNYVMLELILTRYRDRRLVEGLGAVRFLVTSSVRTERGTRCSRPDFILSPGMVHTAPSISTSDQRASLASLVRAAVRTRNSKQARVVGRAADRRTASITDATWLWGMARWWLV